MKQLYPFLLFLLTNSLVFSQADSIQKSPFLKINSIGIKLGMSSIPSTTFFKQSTFAEIAPQNTMLRTDLSGFTEKANQPQDAFHADLNVSFIPKTKDGKYNSRVEFRLGLIYQNSPQKELFFNRTDSIRLDTFSSSSTGMTVYKDSLVYRRYRFAYSGQKVGLDFSNLFQINKHPIFSIYAGYNVCLFYSFDNRIEAGYSLDEGYRRWRGPKRNNYDVRETTSLQNNFILSASIPVGIALRIYKRKGRTITRMAINGELRIGVTEDKIGSKYLDPKPWLVASVGLKLYRHKMIRK